MAKNPPKKMAKKNGKKIPLKKWPNKQDFHDVQNISDLILPGNDWNGLLPLLVLVNIITITSDSTASYFPFNINLQVLSAST